MLRLFALVHSSLHGLKHASNHAIMFQNMQWTVQCMKLAKLKSSSSSLNTTQNLQNHLKPPILSSSTSIKSYPKSPNPLETSNIVFQYSIKFYPKSPKSICNLQYCLPVLNWILPKISKTIWNLQNCLPVLNGFRVFDLVGLDTSWSSQVINVTMGLIPMSRFRWKWQ
jgi:hypothetical protein